MNKMQPQQLTGKTDCHPTTSLCGTKTRNSALLVRDGFFGVRILLTFCTFAGVKLFRITQSRALGDKLRKAEDLTDEEKGQVSDVVLPHGSLMIMNSIARGCYGVGDARCPTDPWHVTVTRNGASITIAADLNTSLKRGGMTENKIMDNIRRSLIKRNMSEERRAEYLPEDLVQAYVQKGRDMGRTAQCPDVRLKCHQGYLQF